MATITISLTGSAIITGSRDYTLSDAMVQRLIDAMKHRHGSGLTNGQLLVAWADGLISETKNEVMQTERNTLTPSPMVIE